jgi:hypothetical protein
MATKKTKATGTEAGFKTTGELLREATRKAAEKAPRSVSRASSAPKAPEAAPAAKAPLNGSGVATLPLSSRLGISNRPLGGSTPASTAPKAVGGKTPTAEQAVILEAVKRRDKVLVVTAGAGTGKTTTLRMIAEVLTGNGQYTAFQL